MGVCGQSVKLFAKNNRARCKGTLLGKKVVSFKKGTIVITKKPERHYFAYIIGASAGNARFVVVSEPLELS